MDNRLYITVQSCTISLQSVMSGGVGASISRSHGITELERDIETCYWQGLNKAQTLAELRAVSVIACLEPRTLHNSEVFTGSRDCSDVWMLSYEILTLYSVWLNPMTIPLRLDTNWLIVCVVWRVSGLTWEESCVPINRVRSQAESRGGGGASSLDKPFKQTLPAAPRPLTFPRPLQQQLRLRSYLWLNEVSFKSQGKDRICGNVSSLFRIFWLLFSISVSGLKEV